MLVRGTRGLLQLADATPDSKVHGANMGPTWVLSAPDGPHAGPMNLAITEGPIALLADLVLYWGINGLHWMASVVIYSRHKWPVGISTVL